MENEQQNFCLDMQAVFFFSVSKRGWFKKTRAEWQLVLVWVAGNGELWGSAPHSSLLHGGRSEGLKKVEWEALVLELPLGIGNCDQSH